LPVGAAPGDVWINPSQPAPAPQYFIGGGGGAAGAWQGNSGAKTFVQDLDPALVPANGVKNGDIWTRPVSAGNPTAVTSVRTAGAWVVGTPSIPASSRTFIQNTAPSAPQNGDLWINTAVTPPSRQYFYGAVAAAPGVAAVAGTWHSDSGARTFVQDADPTTAAGGSITPKNGDSWVTLANVIKTYYNGAWLSQGTAATTSPDFVGIVARKTFQFHDLVDSERNVCTGSIIPTNYIAPGRSMRVTISAWVQKYHGGYSVVRIQIPNNISGAEATTRQTSPNWGGANVTTTNFSSRSYEVVADATPIQYDVWVSAAEGLNTDSNVWGFVLVEALGNPGTVQTLP
jgi:hypothetical protein